MPLVVRAFPLRRPVEELTSFADALGSTRKPDTDAFYRRFGISHESWHLQETEHGPWVIGVSMIDDPAESSQRYAAAPEEFERWFKDRVQYLSGVNPDEKPLGPPTTRVFAWADDKRPNADLCR